MSIAGQRINRESAAREQIIFHPASDDEARDLQEKLFDAGFAWANGNKGVQYLDLAVKNGLVVMGGKIYTRSPTDATPYVPCLIQQLDENYVPPEQRLLVDLFAKVNERLDRIEQRLERLENGGPALDKPHSLKAPQRAVASPKT